MGFGELANGVIQGLLIGMSKSASRDAVQVEKVQPIDTKPVTDQEEEEARERQRLRAEKGN